MGINSKCHGVVIAQVAAHGLTNISLFCFFHDAILASVAKWRRTGQIKKTENYKQRWMFKGIFVACSELLHIYFRGFSIKQRVEGVILYLEDSKTKTKSSENLKYCKCYSKFMNFQFVLGDVYLLCFLLLLYNTPPETSKRIREDRN
jgi:hypothetical protein